MILCYTTLSLASWAASPQTSFWSAWEVQKHTLEVIRGGRLQPWASPKEWVWSTRTELEPGRGAEWRQTKWLSGFEQPGTEEWPHSPRWWAAVSPEMGSTGGKTIFPNLEASCQQFTVPAERERRVCVAYLKADGDGLRHIHLIDLGTSAFPHVHGGEFQPLNIWTRTFLAAVHRTSVSTEPRMCTGVWEGVGDEVLLGLWEKQEIQLLSETESLSTYFQTQWIVWHPDLSQLPLEKVTN